MDETDIELVMRARAANDNKAFATLVKRHQARLRAFLRRVCGDPSLADDIAQDAFLKAHRALSSFKGGGSFRSWLYAIAYREYLQSSRKAKAAARIENALKSATAYAPGNDAKLENELSLDLQRALGALDAQERAAILLCDAAGLSHGEAAVALDAPLGSVKTYVARARQKMRDALEAEAVRKNGEARNASMKGVPYAV